MYYLVSEYRYTGSAKSGGGIVHWITQIVTRYKYKGAAEEEAEYLKENTRAIMVEVRDEYPFVDEQLERYT